MTANEVLKPPISVNLAHKKRLIHQQLSFSSLMVNRIYLGGFKLSKTFKDITLFVSGELATGIFLTFLEIV